MINILIVTLEHRLLVSGDLQIADLQNVNFQMADIVM
jgi:hypothetical protein